MMNRTAEFDCSQDEGLLGEEIGTDPCREQSENCTERSRMAGLPGSEEEAVIFTAAFLAQRGYKRAKFSQPFFSL